ncbi:LysR family transcriptional regulator [Chimaeribacter arupi]|uniref:Transcriptional regulator n=1 Tax=Chimaeribacter arupi TaxID=2060066 RepID=A0A2N5EI88_9GAMM|nr:LysR family transcriptional regulator [Chimaeribacter arupi]MDV5140355.1 LysR family transcriptional regulator [Chimaeribacter arupi]PLR44359.1 transcriptional regulator [Chimaeribacter arupi]
MPIDIKNLDLNLLKAFAALMAERNVTRAAARLSLTQPAVSSMLARLRDSLDDPLFIRAQRGIIPTPRALALALPVEKILADIDALLQPQAFTPATSEMTLTIASTDYALRAVIVPFLSHLRAQAPRLRIAVRPVDNQSLLAQLERGELDLAIVTPEVTPADLHARRLFDETYVCMLREDHPVAKSGNLTLETFCELDHVLVSYEGELFSGVTDQALAGLKKQRRVTLSVTSFLVLPEILRHSDQIAVVPRRLALNTHGLILMTPPLAIPGFTKLVAWHERTHSALAYRWLRTQLFDLFSSTSPPARY